MPVIFGGTPMKPGWNSSFKYDKKLCHLIDDRNKDLYADDNGDIDFLIEYQGVQHYEPKSKFGGIAGLRKQQYYDMLKREYCKKHNIPLVLIPYYDEGRITYDYIMKAAGY